MPSQSEYPIEGDTDALLVRVLAETEAVVLVTTADLDVPGPKIVAASEGFCRLTQYSLEELMGQTPRILQGPLTERAVLDRLRQACSRGEPFVGETVNYRKDQTPYVVEWCIDPIHDTTGKITHFIAVQHDVTRQRRFAERWLESEVKATHALAAATQQMAAIAEAILVLEKTKRSFRSTELGQLRKQLSQLRQSMLESGILSQGRSGAGQ